MLTTNNLFTRNFIKRIITGLTLGLGFWFSFIYLPPIIFSGILLGILLTIIIFEWKHLFDISHPAFWLTLPLYPILPFMLLIIMNQHPVYRSLLFVLFILVSSHDFGSYIVGSLFGKHKIYPRISPNKSWEGFVGGFIFACIGLWLVLYELEKSKAWWLILSFTFIISTLSLVGDLFESWLKRRARIKDTANYLPGHGGFLDRFDGILFAVFFFYLFKDQLVVIFN